MSENWWLDNDDFEGILTYGEKSEAVQTEFSL